jgi:transcriptional regulator with XRE-family HTH domain
VKSTIETLAENLKKYREQSGHTQSSLSEAVDISLRGYQKYEQGVVWPEPAKLDRLAKILDIKVSDLFEKSQPEGPRSRAKLAQSETHYMEASRALAQLAVAGPVRRAIVMFLLSKDEAHLEGLDQKIHQAARLLAKVP